MKRQLTYAAAIAALLLVGAGCAGKQQAAEGLETGKVPAQAEGKMAPQAQVKAAGSVDGTVDAILKDSEDEKAAEKDRASDASNINADDGELNAYSDTTYDLK